FLTGSSRSGRRVLPLANLARLIVVACRVIGSSHLSLSNPSTRKPLGLVHLAQLVGRRREKQGHFGLGVRHESSRRRLRGLLVFRKNDGFRQHLAVYCHPAPFPVGRHLFPCLRRGTVPPSRCGFQANQQLVPITPDGCAQLIRQSGLGMHRQAVTDHPKGGSPPFDGLEKLVHRHVGLPSLRARSEVLRFLILRRIRVREVSHVVR